MLEIRLPLSALERSDACELAYRVAAFTARHGHPPGEASTWAEWCAVTPSLRSRLWAVACALPLVYPARRAELLRLVVEVAYRAAKRAQPADTDPRAAEALDLVRRWLDGEPIAANDLCSAAADAADAADAAAAGADAAYAAAAGADAAYAAACGADAAAADAAAGAYAADDDVYAAYAADDDVYAAYAAAYVADAATNACAACAVAAAERALQAQDLDELLTALCLEVLDG